MAADTVRDLLLDDSGDLAIVAGDLVLTRGADAIVQAVSNRLQFFKGEWFLDPDAGLPYYQEILVKSPQIGALTRIFREAIEQTPGVLSVDSLDLDFVRSARRLSVSYTATTDVGEIGATEVL